MDVINLRTLTLKSIIGFGHYNECTVKELLERNKIKYLVAYYFCCSKISYVDNVLKLLRITKEHQIEKPGKNIDAYNRFLENVRFSTSKSMTSSSDDERTTNMIRFGKTLGDVRKQTERTMKMGFSNYVKHYRTGVKRK